MVTAGFGFGGAGKEYVGRSIRRCEDPRLLAGEGKYLADLAGRDTLHAAFVRSTQASARLEAIDVTAAAAVPGVLAVFTGFDLPTMAEPLPALGTPEPSFVTDAHLFVSDAKLPCLPTGWVHYVGQAIAVVVADSRRVAEDAAEQVLVTYAPRQAVLDARAALSPDTPLVHPHLADNEAARICVAFGDVEDQRARAHLVVADRYRVGRHGAVPLECRGVLVHVAAQRLEVWTSTQIPHLVRRAICAVAGWDLNDVRVAAPEVGGGFGVKGNVYAEEVVLPVLAKRLGRDVIWIEDRLEHLTSAAQGRDQEHQASLAVDAEGHIMAWEDDFLVDVGAGSLWTAGIVANTAIHLMGPYRVPAFRASGRAAYTNKTIVSQYRGAGRPEACFALERSLDRAADELGIDRIEIRRRNLLTAADLPYPRPVLYRDGVQISYDGGDYLACLESCLELLPQATQVLEAGHPTERIGHGVAAYIEATGRGPWETGRVTLTTPGRFEIAAGSASAGQGQETTLSQIAADALCVSPDEITVLLGDTDAIVDGIGTFASRSAVTAGNAVRAAADSLVEQARELAAECLAVAPDEVTFRAGRFSSAAGRGLTWKELAQALHAGGRMAGRAPLQANARYEPPTVTWTMGVHAAVVAVDSETGLCRVVRYAVVHDGGIEINPAIVEGQVIGGVAQGLGGALLEEFRYDSEGQPLSVTMADYLLPTASEVPTIAVRHIPVATAVNPLGVRGVGESGTIAVYAAVASAIEAALGSGVHITSVPIEPSALAGRA